MRTRTSHEHLGQSLGHLWFIVTIALEDLGVELALTISGTLQVLDPIGGGHQVARVGAIALPFALGAALSPTHADQRVKLLAHHVLQECTNGAVGQVPQILLGNLLIRQRWN